MLILLWVQNEVSYNRFHTNADNLYRVVQARGRVTSPPIAPTLKEEIPEVIDATRFRPLGQCLLKHEGQAFRGSRLALADPSFFTMFTVSFLNGDPSTALDAPYAMVLTEETATLMFGDQDPIGQTINYNNQTDFHVTGVIKSFPETSHMKFDLLARFDFLAELGVNLEDWEDFSYRNHVLLPDNVELVSLNRKINDMYDRHSPGNTRTLHLQPITDIHLYEVSGAPGAIIYVYIFSAVSLIILAIACINFINLATARGARRAREIGVRKVVGAARQNLILQFLGESLLMALVSFLLAGAIVELALPMFNDLTGKQLSLNLTGNLAYFAGAVGIVSLTGLLAGIFPALYLSSFKPVMVLKGTPVAGGGRSPLRKVLVVTQFSLSIFLIIGSLVIQRQLEFVRGADLGYDRENIICLQTNSDEIMQVAPAFEEISQHTGIVEGTISGNLPGRRESNTDRVSWDGKNPDERVVMEVIYAGHGFLETFGLELAEGRFYSPEFPTDLQDAFVVNEAAVRAMGITEGSGLGQQFSLNDKTGIIVGVVKDFHSQSLRHGITPLVFSFWPWTNDNLTFRLNPEDVPGTLAFMESIWSEHAPDYPFEFKFFDEFLDDQYQAEKRMGKIFNYFTLLAIFISCLGLLGLISFMAEQRTKEIGIRKVLGASVSRIVRLMTTEFVVLVAISNAIAWPVAYFVMDSWLGGFAYRTGIGWQVFVLSGGVSVLVALATVSFKAIRAARTNPVDTLKYE
jgi:ABC-type antimicrobial peptide transport system permease subunit